MPNDKFVLNVYNKRLYTASLKLNLKLDLELYLKNEKKSALDKAIRRIYPKLQKSVDHDGIEDKVYTFGDFKALFDSNKLAEEGYQHLYIIITIYLYH